MLKENRALIENGGALHWLAPRGKNPISDDWSTAPINTFDALRASRPGKSNNIGLRLGEYSRIGGLYAYALDLDIRTPEYAAEAHAVLTELLPDWQTNYPRVRSGSGGLSRHVHFLSEQPWRSKKLAQSEGFFVDAAGKRHRHWEIELFGTGKQVALPPSIHPDTGLPYVWEREYDWLDVAMGHGPIVPLERMRAWQVRTSQKAVDDEDDELLIVAAMRPLDLPDEQIDKVLGALPANFCEDRTEWRDVGMALHHQYEGTDAGLEKWREFSKKSAKFDERVLCQQWESFKGTDSPKTFASLLQVVRALEKEDPYGDLRDDDTDELSDEDAKIIATAVAELDEEDDDEDGIYGDATPAAPATSAIWDFGPDDCANAPSRGYVIKGMLAPRDVACIFGAPGAGKSLISPHLGYRVAQGEYAFNMRTKPGKVLYIAAEDAHGMQGRVSALRRRHGKADDFRLIGGVSDLFIKESGDLKAVRALAKSYLPQIIFIDTLAMAFPGLEENDAQSMGRVVAIARKLTKHGAAVVLIHHDTKTAGGTPRGHSVLNGALDMAMWLQAKDEFGIVRGTLTKNRNGSIDRDIAFKIAVEEMGLDEDGDPITYALAEEMDARATPNTIRLAPAERSILKILRTHSDDGITISELALRTACIDGREVSAAEDPQSRKRAFNRAYSALVKQGHLRCVNEVIHLSAALRAENSIDSAADEWSGFDLDDDLI